MIYADISWIYNHVLVALLSSSVDNYDNRVRRGISTTRSYLNGGEVADNLQADIHSESRRQRGPGVNLVSADVPFSYQQSVAAGCRDEYSPW